MSPLRKDLTRFIMDLDFREVPSRTELDYMDAEFLAEKILKWLNEEHDRQMAKALGPWPGSE